MTDSQSCDNNVVFAQASSIVEGHITTITVEEDLSFQVHIEGRVIPQHCFELQKLCSVSSVLSLMSVVNGHKLCSGNPDTKFISLAKTRKGEFKSNSGIISMYNYVDYILIMTVLGKGTDFAPQHDQASKDWILHDSVYNLAYCCTKT